MENLVEALRRAGHRVELVRLPVAWDKDRVLDSALAWRLLSLDCDLVIATNFPSYFVRHPRKVVWLFHQHRVAYDAIDSGWSDIGLDERSLRIQSTLVEWDTRVLEEAQRLFTTSGVVAGRLARFNGLEATPLYHPPPLHHQLRSGPPGDYVFCPSRLERNKRPDLMVEAMGRVSTPTRLKLAGTGSMERELREMSARDNVDLLGFVPDDQLIDLYAGALGVIYVPFDEDYGYVTLQAFLAGKPVICTTDSGGVLEWVDDGVTGFVTDPDASSIAAAIDALYEDRERAVKMGIAAKERVAGLDWEHVVAALTT